MKYFKKRVFIALFWLSCILLGNMSASAQTPTVTFINPTNGMTNVQTDPVVTIRTNLKIDVSSTQFQFPGHEDGVTHDYGDLSLMVIPDYAYTSVSSTDWKWWAVRGILTQVNDTTIKLDSVFLVKGETYHCIVNNLQGVTSLNDTVSFPTTQISFRAVDPLPSLRITSFITSGTAIKCSDTISAQMSRKLSSATTMSGDIMEILRVTGSSAPIDTFGFEHTTSTIATSTWLDTGDSSKVYVKPSSALTPGDQYILKINLSRVTGDTNDDYQRIFTAKNSAIVNLQVAATNSAITVPLSCYPAQGVGEFNIGVGDSIAIDVPPMADSMEFAGWICPEDPSISGISPNLLLNISCNNAINRNITATFSEIPKVNIVVQNAFSSPHGGVIVLNGDSLAGTFGTYRLFERYSAETLGKDRLIVIAKPDSGYDFTGWVSGNPAYNGILTTTITVKGAYGPANLTPTFAPTSGPCPSYKICVTVFDADGQPVSPGSINTNPNPCAFSRSTVVTASVIGGLNSCYRIVGIASDDGQINWSPSGWDPTKANSILSPAFPVTIKDDRCEMSVVVIVTPKRYTLTDEIVISNGGLLPQPQYNLILNTMLNPQGKLLQPQTVSVDKKKVTRVTEYKCNTVVTATPTILNSRSGYTIGYWNCNTPYLCNNIINIPRNILQFTMSRNWRIQHVYTGPQFYVTRIGFGVNSSTIQWYDVNALDYPYDRDGLLVMRNIELAANSGKTVEMFVEFNLDVNISTVNNNLTAREESDRLDCGTKRNFTFNTGATGYNGSLYNSQTVRFILRNNPNSGFTTVTEELSLNIAQAIQSTTGINLNRSYSGRFQTRMHGVRYTMTSVSIGKDTDDDGTGEVYGMVMMPVGANNVAGTPNPNPMVTIGDCNWGDWQTKSINTVILDHARLSTENDQIGFGAFMWDDDGTDLFNHCNPGCIYADRTSIKNYVTGQISGIPPSTWTNIGSRMKDKAALHQCSDDILDNGSVSHLFNTGNRWGVPKSNCLTYTGWSKSSGTTRYYMTIELLVP